MQEKVKRFFPRRDLISLVDGQKWTEGENALTLHGEKDGINDSTPSVRKRRDEDFVLLDSPGTHESWAARWKAFWTLL